MNKEISIKEIRKKLKEIIPQVSETYQILDIKNCYSEVKLLTNKNKVEINANLYADLKSLSLCFCRSKIIFVN